MSSENRDYVEPAPVAMFEMGELLTWSYYRAVIAEFVATLLFLYIIVAIIIGHKKQHQPCDGVGLLGISWGVGGMIFVLVYCTAGISGIFTHIIFFPGVIRNSYLIPPLNTGMNLFAT